MNATKMMSATKIVDQIFTLFETRGHEQFGENVSALQHALQCAYLARRAEDAAHLIAACLLHDYGKLLSDDDIALSAPILDAHHALLGAHELARYFLPVVTEPIRLHVAAKRYLCWLEPEYFERLSPSSRHSLHLQGGIMFEVEAEKFARKPHCQSAVWLRRYDDEAKALNVSVPGLESYRSLLEAFVLT